MAAHPSDSIHPPEEFLTERLRLRRPAAGDAEAIFASWARDTNTLRYLAWEAHTDVSQTVAHVARCEAAWADGSAYTWFIEARETGTLLGSLACRISDHGVNVGYVLAPAGRGHGYMREALTLVTAWWLDAGGKHRVWATCHTENHQSARVLEKAGFTLEGNLRRWGPTPNLGDAPCDHLCFSRVRGDPPREPHV